MNTDSAGLQSSGTCGGLGCLVDGAFLTATPANKLVALIVATSLKHVGFSLTVLQCLVKNQIQLSLSKQQNWEKSLTMVWNGYVYRANLCRLLTRATSARHSDERKSDSRGFLPSMQKEKMDQGLNNSSHRGKYIGLNSLLGAASSRWVNMSDRQSLLHTFSVQTHKHAVKQATGSNKPAQGLFPYSHERTNCFSFFFSKQSINCSSDVVTFAPLSSQMLLPQSVFFASLTVSSAADKHISCCIFVYVPFASNRSVYCIAAM